MINFKQKGDFSNLEKYLNKARNIANNYNLDNYGKMGVAALASATPRDTGETAKSWYYEIERKNGSTIIHFNNSNIQNGCPIAIILQYGHGIRNGGWVEGRDYINPAIQPIFDEISKKAWKEVTSL